MSDLPQDWPLTIHKSFWEDWPFIKWQALRRNPRYRREINKLYKESPDLFQISEIARFFKDYTPPPPKSLYNTWRYWVINQTGQIKSSKRLGRQITEQLLSRSFTSRGIDLWPVPPSVCFPHPYHLDKLRPLPFAIPIEPVNRKPKSLPYAVFVETGFPKPKYLQLDISLPEDILRRAVVEYLRGLKIVLRQKKQVLNLKSAIPKVLRQIPRRAMSLHTEKVPYCFAVWDLKEKGLNFPQIAGALWPDEYDPNDKEGYPGLREGIKYPAVQRVQDSYSRAKLLIDLIIEPPISSIT